MNARRLDLGKRIMLEGPSTGWYAGHGGDEYGNCSLYVRTPWFGVVVSVDLDYQDGVEMPDPGENAWVDAKYYGDWHGETVKSTRKPPGNPGRPEPAEEDGTS